MNLSAVKQGQGVLLAASQVEPGLLQRIKDAQQDDVDLQEVRDKLELGEALEYSVGSDDIIRLRGRICIPEDAELRGQILSKGHCSRFSVRRGGIKMYKNLRSHYWWPRMKRDVQDFVARCAVCQQVKAKHLIPGGYLQPLDVPTWKW